MICTKAAEIDFEQLLATDGDAGVEEFRAHYPGCADCSVEVRAWMSLEAHMRVGAEDARHPAEELLLRYDEAPARLSAHERRELDSHLATCPSCRDELAAMRAFDIEALKESAALQPAAAPSAPAWLDRLRLILWQPAFAYGLLALVAVPALLLYLGRARPAEYRSLGPTVLRDATTDSGQPERQMLRLNPSWTEREQGELPEAVLHDLGAELSLLISLPIERQEGVMLDVGVSGPQPQRQLRDRVAWSEEITVAVPRAWLRPGRYTVEIHPVDPPAPLPALPLYGFVVR